MFCLAIFYIIWIVAAGSVRFGSVHPLCPLKWLSICQDLRLPGFVFANNLGHIVREQVPTMGHDLVLAVISQAVRNCCSLLVTCCTQQHWFPHSGQFNIYSPVFVFSSISFFLFLALTSQVSAQWSFCQDLVLIIWLLTEVTCICSADNLVRI